jgi:hypothetical protein
MRWQHTPCTRLDNCIQFVRGFEGRCKLLWATRAIELLDARLDVFQDVTIPVQASRKPSSTSHKTHLARIGLPSSFKCLSYHGLCDTLREGGTKAKHLKGLVGRARGAEAATYSPYTYKRLTLPTTPKETDFPACAWYSASNPHDMGTFLTLFPAPHYGVSVIAQRTARPWQMSGDECVLMY